MIEKTANEGKDRKVAMALDYAAKGWRVVPNYGVLAKGVCECREGAECISPGKHPRINEWQHNATTDAETIIRWGEKWPLFNPGVQLGPASGIVDLEHDTDEGKATADELLGGCFTSTFTSYRSKHRLFQFPFEVVITKAVVKIKGLEFRFGTDEKGAQSVFPPSTHSELCDYRWLKGLSHEDVEPMPMPANLLTLVIADWSGAATASDRLAFVFDGDLRTNPGVEQGKRNETLCKLVGAYLAEHGIDNDLIPLATEWGRRCSPPYPEAEVQKTVIALAEKHAAKSPQTLSLALGTTSYVDVEPEEIAWLWKDRIALGKLTLSVGQPGLGKTFLACDTAARVSRGEAFPDGTLPPCGEILFATAEDGAADTIRPRLDAHGADVTKIHNLDFVKGTDGKEEFFCLDDHLPALDQWLSQHSDTVLVIIDPISAFMGKIDTHNNAEVRGVLGPVAKVAERHDVAILGITHLSKKDAKAINRVIGSIAFVAAARAAWLIAQDPDDEERRLFVPIKNNLAKSSGLAYRIEDGQVEWDSMPVLISADELGDDGGSPRDEARRWLEDLLADGPVPAKQVLRQAKQDGISERTLYRAKKELKITSDKDGNSWAWALRESSDTNNSFTF